MQAADQIPQAGLTVLDDPATAASLLDPLRREMLRVLDEGPASATQIAARVGQPRQKVAYHARELESAGLVELVEERRKGNCVERVLRRTAGAFLIDPAIGGGELDPESLQDAFSATYLVALAARTLREAAGLKQGAEREGKRLATAGLDGAVRLASPEGFAAFASDLADAVAAVVARHHDEQAVGGRWFRVVAGTYARPARPTAGGGVSKGGKQ